MITVFNRRRLMTDSSGEAVAAARDALRAAGIPFQIKTVQNQTGLGRAIRSGAGVGAYGGGMPASSFSQAGSYVYFIYVRKKDLDRARAVIRTA